MGTELKIKYTDDIDFDELRDSQKDYEEFLDEEELENEEETIDYGSEVDRIFDEVKDERAIKMYEESQEKYEKI